jgi:ankyrin repeat protein
MNAANSNSLEVVKFLSASVKDINLKGKNGQSALAKAVNKNSIEVVQFLLKKGADIDMTDAENNTLSFYLLNNFNANKPEIFEGKLRVLKENGLVVNQIQHAKNTLLQIATERNDLSLLKRLASLNIAINNINEEGLTALQIAAMKAKDTKIIEYLIRIGANKNVKTDFDESIYDLASENELLKEKKANIAFLKL